MNPLYQDLIDTAKALLAYEVNPYWEADRLRAAVRAVEADEAKRQQRKDARAQKYRENPEMHGPGSSF